MSITNSEKKSLDLLVDKLRDRYGPRLAHTFLFGSKARGDDGPDSDIDMLTVLNDNVGDEERATISTLVYEVLESTGVYIQTVIISQEEFEHPKGQMRWLTSFVREDGKVL